MKESKNSMLEIFLFIISIILGFISGCLAIAIIIIPARKLIDKNLKEISQNLTEIFSPNTATENIATETNPESEKNKSVLLLIYSAFVFLFDGIIFTYGNLTAFWTGFGIIAAIFLFFMTFILRFLL